MTTKAVCLLAAGLALSAMTHSVAAATGDLWQVTTTMSMEGMPSAMPARAASVCTAKTWSQPPGSANSSCTRSDFHVDGAKTTWTETCTNPPMTGHGEITRHSDTFTGAITFESPQGNMKINLDGQRTGDCDVPQ
jgi:hypothetical protein